MRLLGVFISAVMLGASPGWAQVATPPAPTSPEPTSPDPNSAVVDDVTVVGSATVRAMAAYARTIGSGPMGRLSPRWNDRICVRVIDMDAEHARILKDRIDTVAQAIGLTPDPSPTCRPDISVFASDDPDGLADLLIETVPRNFRPARTNVSLGDAALDVFRTSDAPVRWWQVSLPLMVDSGELAIVLGATETTMSQMTRQVTVRNASRLRGNVRDDLFGVTVIIDTGKVNSVPFSALSDYVAFVALAPADPRAPTARFNTVLNLFDQPGVTGLSPMDEDYLYALYTASRAPSTAGLQATEIASRMATERNRRGAAAN